MTDDFVEGVGDCFLLGILVIALTMIIPVMFVLVLPVIALRWCVRKLYSIVEFLESLGAKRFT